jgi:hypothetical protein
MNTNMTYDMLYSNMVKKFTVEKNNVDYKLGDYMLMKAKSKRSQAAERTEKSSSLSGLPAQIYHREKSTPAVSTFISYINEKLTVKEAPIKDKTIRSFPLRTSFTAFCSAVLVCSLVLCCGIFGISAGNSLENTANADGTEIVEEIESVTESATDCEE